MHGTPCLTVTDGTGKDYYAPLRLKQVTERKRKSRPQIATLWAVPDKPLTPAHLRGATTRIRHTRTKQERDAGKSRSRALRVYPESDRRFSESYGLREDSESCNADYKSRLWNGRCRTLRHNTVDFSNVAYQLHTLITAVAAHHRRTGSDLTPWFGQHRPAVKGRLLAVAA